MAVADVPAPASCQRAFTHPLELIPFVRRWPRSVPRDLLYTLTWNALLAGVFTGLALLLDPRPRRSRRCASTWCSPQAIGFVIHGLFLLGDRVFPGIHQAATGKRFFYYTSVPIVGVFLGYWAGAEWLGYTGFLRWLFTPRGFAAVTFLSFLISAILLMFILQRERAARAEAAAAREQARVAAAEEARPRRG